MNHHPATRLLVVDDEYAVRDSVSSWFARDGHTVDTAENGVEALRLLQEQNYDAVLLDLKMPGMDGMEVQQKIHEIRPELPVIMITAFASIETAVRALKQGAFDYVTKPIDPDELSHLVHRALEHRKLKRENTQLKETIDELTEPYQIIGDSPAIQQVLELVRSVGCTDATTLITGESGTGKELVARAIHANSARRYLPIVTVNCGALTETLLESELFGHEKGAFTGAHFRRKGKLEMAHGGTLFLDEVGTIHPKTQVDLLRVLESKEFTRVGGTQMVRVDFRVIAATNEDLKIAVSQGRFREDLYYRLNVFNIVVPPLRERPGDIALLAEHFRRRLAGQMDKRITGFAPEALRILTDYHWPGNVRELANAVERAMVVGTPPVILPRDLPILEPARPNGGAPESLALTDMEKHHIASVLAKFEWNISHSAHALGIDRATLYSKIKKYDLRK